MYSVEFFLRNAGLIEAGHVCVCVPLTTEGEGSVGHGGNKRRPLPGDFQVVVPACVILCGRDWWTS